MWQRGGERAPHKPLLVLLALGRRLRDGQRMLSFRDVDDALGQLLREFGPARRSVHPEYPFWRLQNDGIWQVRSAEPMRVREGNADPPRSELLARGAEGGFMPEAADALRSDRRLARAVAQAVQRVRWPHSGTAFQVNYATSIPMADTARLAAEARALWEVLRPDAERAGVCSVLLQAQAPPTGVVVLLTEGYAARPRRRVTPGPAAPGLATPPARTGRSLTKRCS